MISYAKTALGTPVYKIEVPKDFLAGAGRCHNPPPYGKLSAYLKVVVQSPALVIVHYGKKFTRVFRLCEDGMLVPSSLDVIPRDEKRKLVAAGIMTKSILKT